MPIVALTKWLSQARGSCPPLYYHPLDPGSHEIRLLTPLKVDAKDRVECKLVTVPLRSCPPFAALCDNSERGHQVQLTREIFSGAEVVMCWLPSASTRFFDEVSDDDRKEFHLRTAFETFELISKELRIVEEEAGKTILETDHSDERLISWLERVDQVARRLRDWGVAVLVEQEVEVALARDPLMSCKSSSLSFRDTFSRAMAWFDILAYGKLPDPSFASTARWNSFINADGPSHAMFFGEANADFGVFADKDSSITSIQGSSLFVDGVVIDSVQELYTSVLECKDLAPFLSVLLRPPE
ncbi:hypothetical protein INS49_015129 [Diaporthe citri]|uniref:uncharacterized protein n=1 Tax=Diaporthe citri TaxID=83186 RepID=UPI001C812B4E|nr:uncharacterized protein INS49_015129 [Diaporthe citri]KAG6357251.1 hypothetical protein INS49_015129 [Diaporthe citri]